MSVIDLKRNIQVRYASATLQEGIAHEHRQACFFTGDQPHTCAHFAALCFNTTAATVDGNAMCQKWE